MVQGHNHDMLLMEGAESVLHLPARQLPASRSCQARTSCAFQKCRGAAPCQLESTAMCCADEWVLDHKCTMALAERHLHRAMSLRGVGVSDIASPAVIYHLERCDALLAAVHMGAFASEHAAPRLPHASKSAAADEDAQLLSHVDDDDPAGAEAAAAAGVACGLPLAVQYHWARGHVCQLQGNPDTALTHFEVCEALCQG